MSKTLTLELSDDAYEALRQRANAEGCEPEKLLTASIARLLSDAPVKGTSHPGDQNAVKGDFRSVFGIVNLPDAAGLTNEQMDEILAKEYMAQHEEP